MLILSRQKDPNPPSELRRQIKQYKILVNITRYYSDFTIDNPAPPQSDSYFTKNVRSGALSELRLIFSRLNRRTLKPRT